MTALLHAAATHDKNYIVEILLKNKADLEARNKVTLIYEFKYLIGNRYCFLFSVEWRQCSNVGGRIWKRRNSRVPNEKWSKYISY